jgi:hypothetical protein
MWSSLLTEPKAVLGPYAGTAPELNSFVPHSWRCDFDEVSIAGQFLELPLKPPEKWMYSKNHRAYAVFVFSGVRALQSSGLLAADEEDDLMHGEPVGVPGVCELKELAKVSSATAESGNKYSWRSFYLTQSRFSIRLEAQHVTLYVGRQASRQYGWPMSDRADR